MVAMQDFRKMIVAVESKSEGGSITDKLDGLLSKSDTIASTLFKEVLERKEKADATRNALNVLQRFKFVLFIPWIHYQRHRPSPFKGISLIVRT